ncbi:hypothetical protein D5018_01160 [Parashewanella curva]|uniref:Uncharacterized protein n=1 Tax=Parashewanella curva TaxID=2338552 RepID=A0A3L8Q231_9GAMM|nr:hypothetical protein [Parashewanella curva]RLV61747.1 hypothetical protein D5018_01160 [Parashewanella curva]
MSSAEIHWLSSSFPLYGISYQSEPDAHVVWDPKNSDPSKLNIQYKKDVFDSTELGSVLCFKVLDRARNRTLYRDFWLVNCAKSDTEVVRFGLKQQSKIPPEKYRLEAFPDEDLLFRTLSYHVGHVQLQIRRGADVSNWLLKPSHRVQGVSKRLS